MENLRVVVVFFFVNFILVLFIFIQNLRVVVVVEEAEAKLSINFDFFLFMEQKCAVLQYPPILHINWPEDSIKLIQSNLELRTEFQIVSNYSTLILRKIDRMKNIIIFRERAKY